MLRKQLISLSRRVYSTDLGSEFKSAKPYDQIPKVSYYKLIKESLPGGRYRVDDVRKTTMRMYEDFGEIFRMPAMLGKPEMLMTFNAENFEKVFRAEGVWPNRIGMESLDYYRKTKRPEVYGDLGSLIVSQGEKWAHMRTIANPILMQPKTIKKYTIQIDDIAKEFIELMRKLRNEKSEMPGNFSNYVNTWSLESVTAVGLERRLNLFDENTKDENAKKLIRAVREFFETTPKFEFELSIWRYYHTKGFKDLLALYDRLTDVILHYINQSAEEMKNSESSSDHEDSVLRKLLKADKKVAMVVASDLMLAGVDTTASAALNNLYILAKNPEKQEILRQEIKKILPEKTSKLTPEAMKNMPYLRAVIKETMRVLPITSGNARQVQNDVVLSGYQVPAKTQVVMQFILENMNEKNYSEPEKYMPERWLRVKTENSSKLATTNPFAFLPFGFGARSCLGKRIAELELEALLANIIRNFKVEWHYPDMKIKSTFVNIPDSEMRFKVIDV